MTFEEKLSEKEMLAKLKELGLGLRYLPIIIGEPANGEQSGRWEIALASRRPVRHQDGYMSGAEFVCDIDGVQVWTSQKNKAMAIGRQLGIKVRGLDGEAEIVLPYDKADAFLRGFGAKVRSNRRPMTTEQLNALKARFAEARNRAKSGNAPHTQGTSGQGKV